MTNALWKKKLVVSQLALACTLAITSQANATTYDTGLITTILPPRLIGIIWMPQALLMVTM